MTETISIAFTAAGAPQAATLIRQLRDNGERPVRLIALDMNEDVVGRFMADVFYKIPEAGSPAYEDALLEILAKERPDALLNCSERDVFYISRMKEAIEALGTGVICPNADAVELTTNKYKLYTALKDVEGVDVPIFHAPTSLDEFVQTAREMGYPERDLCFKPHVSKGSRGFRILTERYDRRELLLNHKPIARYMPLEDFVSIFRGHDDFPSLLLMEMVTGEEHDVMMLAFEGESLLTSVKTRESHRWGVIDRGELVYRPDILDKVARIASSLSLSYNVFIQFIGGKLIEMGPRTSTYIFDSEFAEPWLSVKLVTGLMTPDEVKEYRARVPYGRRMIRYMDQVFYNKPDVIS